MRCRLFLFRLPELDLGAVGIDDPGEGAHAVHLLTVEDLYALLFDVRQKPFKIVDREADHELARGRFEVIGVGLERRPHRLRRAVVTLCEKRAAPILDIKAERIAVPIGKRLRIGATKKEAAIAGDARHRKLSW